MVTTMNNCLKLILVVFCIYKLDLQFQLYAAMTSSASLDF